MGLNLEEKQAVVAEVSAEVARAQAIVLAEYRGLEVGNMTALRREARKSGVYLRVLKNTLARRAVKDTPFEKLADQMVGPLVYGISSDPVATAKVLSGRGDLPQGGPGARQHAEPRAAACHANGHDAGAGRQVRADAQRSAGEVRPHRCRAARRAREGRCLIPHAYPHPESLFDLT